MTTYRILRTKLRPEYASIEDAPQEGFEDAFMMNQGEPCSAAVTGTVVLSITKKHKGMKLDDFIFNLRAWLIVTERVKDVFAAECGNVEIFPAEIRDQKGKPVKAPYCLVHPVGTVDCVDLQRSKFRPEPGEPGMVQTFYSLVLDERRIPGDLKLFRIKPMPQAIIIRSDLVEKLEAMGAGGHKLWDLGAPIML